MSQPLRNDCPTIPLDDAATCANCGYSLRGLAMAGQCPECGFTVWASLRQDHLADTPAAWRGRLQRGSMILYASLAAIVPLNLAPAVLLAIAAMLPAERLSTLPDDPPCDAHGLPMEMVVCRRNAVTVG